MEDCKLEIKLADRPGELSKVLDIIAKNRGNLFAVSHIREGAREGRVPVVIQFQAIQVDFNSIVSDLEKAKIEISEKLVGGVEEAGVEQEFILIGHVIDTDIKDTIYGICDKDVMIKSLDISLKSLKDPSSVFTEISAKNTKAMTTSMAKLEAIAKKKKLLLITGINST